MAGLVPAIHVGPRLQVDVDARDTPGHDNVEKAPLRPKMIMHGPV